VQGTKKVIAAKDMHFVPQTTSGERGTLVTTCCFISAMGTCIPPVMIFPRVNFKNNMLIGAYPGTKGLATKNGWMNSETFVETLKHFNRYTNSSKENETLLLVDNVESHLSIESLDLAKNNGITMLTFPSKCTHKLQPLDVGIFGPFNSVYDGFVSGWITSYPGEQFTI